MTITITDNAGVVEGETVIVICNNKEFTSLIKNGIAKFYTSEVGTYTIIAGDYSTVLVCPYFGNFSTDIYSGTLKVTCTDLDGNGKTCQVRSCDDDYNFTSNYNLTQTFDSGLELTFLGIPTGKYLITVDDRYRFFKEIVSIQNINEVEVELKQWLYKNGDECVHNTGGWMKCKIEGSSDTRWRPTAIYNSTIGESNSINSQSVQFLANSVRMQQKCISNTISQRWESGYYYARAPVHSCVNCGTKNNLPMSFNKYKKIIHDASQPITIVLRSGEKNNTNTDIKTATIVVSGTSKDIEINTVDTIGSIVIGNNVTAYGYGYNPSTGSYYQNGNKISSQNQAVANSINVNIDSEITQLYLV